MERFEWQPPLATSRHSLLKFPMLEKEQEFQLARDWIEREDTESAHLMVTSHLRLAAKIAMGYRGYGLPISEVVSEANVGLMQAVKRFDPDKGFRLATYAMWWIRASIQEYILREGDLRPENVQTIAKQLSVSEADVVSMNRRMGGGGDASLNAPLKGDGDGVAEWQDWLPDDDVDTAGTYAKTEEHDKRMDLLTRAMDVLNEREQHILTERKLKEDPVTLEDLSSVYNVSRERIRQIEVRAFEKLSEQMRALAAEEGMIEAEPA